jgi:hypothetical protein
MDVGKGVCNVNAPERFVDTKTCQFLVDYPFLVLVPSSLQQNLSFAVSEIKSLSLFPEGRRLQWKAVEPSIPQKETTP